MATKTIYDIGKIELSFFSFTLSLILLLPPMDENAFYINVVFDKIANELKENFYYIRLSIEFPCVCQRAYACCFYESSEFIPMAIYLRHLLFCTPFSFIHNQMNAKPLTIYAGK